MDFSIVPSFVEVDVIKIKISKLTTTGVTYL